MPVRLPHERPYYLRNVVKRPWLLRCLLHIDRNAESLQSLGAFQILQFNFLNTLGQIPCRLQVGNIFAILYCFSGL